MSLDVSGKLGEAQNAFFKWEGDDCNEAQSLQLLHGVAGLWRVRTERGYACRCVTTKGILQDLKLSRSDFQRVHVPSLHPNYGNYVEVT